MASIQEPEVQFAQKLASNEKSTRTKAIKKLRKYISVRSQKAAGGFRSDELLKLWKGLFYCLWMQDKPLLQEELSKQISTLIHSFHNSDGQFLYLESFLLTFKREWTGIDRLRMDKFFQLVRFMFRQTFELLKKKNWESSEVSRFLQLLVAQLLQSGSEAPSGLQFHILDLYMTELAAVGSAELTADQNLTFIEPFCKTAARTKDRSLFGAICNSIFSTIIDQAPFAIEDLMKEVKAAEDSESEDASEEDLKDQIKDKNSKPLSKKQTGKQVNGNTSDEDDELLHLEDSDTELPGDDDIGPVLQFDYAALADKLLELSGRSSTPSQNRQRLYKIIKVLRDLGEGIFPQDEYPEEVSTDEDDDMFGSRKRMKRGGGHMEEDEEGNPAAKKSKGKKKEALTLNKQTNDQGKDEQADLNSNDENKKKKKKKKKKKAGKDESTGVEENAEKSEQGHNEAQAPSTVKETEGNPQCSPAAEAQSSISSVKVTAAATSEGQSETLVLSEVKKKPSVTVTEEASTTDNKDQSQTISKKKKKKDTSEPKPQVAETEEQQTAQVSPEADAPVSGKKKKKRSLEAESQTDEVEAQSQVNTEAEITSGSCEETTMTTPETNALTPSKKKSKKKSLKADAQVEVDTEISFEASQRTAAVPLKKTKKQILESSAAVNESTRTLLKNKRKSNQKEAKTAEEEERVAEETPQTVDAEKLLLEITMTTPTKKKKASKARIQTPEITVDEELPLDETEVVSSSRKPTKKRRKIPVVFEFEADEQEAKSINGLTEEEMVAKKTKLGNDVDKPSTPLSSKKSLKKAKTASQPLSDFITFQSNTVAPTPLFCKTKGGCSTPLSRKKKSQTPKSESKKVTFGLKNNKTAEFRKTDRSLLVSPDGSSRVAFDPKQKPKFGVLKSPPTPRSTTIKKKPNANRKTSLNTQKNTPKRRPSAADFF
ncbi:ribosomal RNA processing protein 1 homolog B-like isoform X1 [Seriola lalandi dorsalis]|uniref:Ribosomal RNA processing protein 1 homolog B-like n=1 Tax=Seriola lalandi dorsalis TaxID=1841481 RepID=A0A3B4WL39_SERLL|nr:ribosomal RNA processing protein 1 homolog B-like isoform X1 [Seriola lalandi dorsalis]